jgi:hypothetical protein
MDLDQLLQSLAVTLGLPTLRFDANGCARIAIEGAPALNFERDTSGTALHLYSVLGPLPSEGRETLYTQLLQGNLFGTATAGASLAIDDLHGEVVLCRTVKTDAINGPAFAALVETFVAAAEDWQGRLNSAPAAAQMASEPLAPRMMSQFLRG